MSYIPKYIIKRMFKRDECLALVKKDGIEWIQLTMLNVISPITVPEGKIDLGGVNLPADIDKMIKINVNGVDCPVNADMLVNDVELWESGNKHTWKSIFEGNSASGKTIPVGGKLSLLVKKKAFPPAVQDMMKANAVVKVKVDANMGGSMSIEAEAELKQFQIDFDPKKT